MTDGPGPWPELESSPWGQCLNWLCEEIVLLDLPGIGGRVYIRDPAVVKETNLPAVIIDVGQTGQPSSHSPSDGTLTAPDRVLRATVGFVYGSDGVNHCTLAERLEQDHLIFKAFSKRSQRRALTGAAAGCWHLSTNIEPGSPSAQIPGFVAGHHVVAFLVRYPSTSGD